MFISGGNLGNIHFSSIEMFISGGDLANIHFSSIENTKSGENEIGSLQTHSQCVSSPNAVCSMFKKSQQLLG